MTTKRNFALLACALAVLPRGASAQKVSLELPIANVQFKDIEGAKLSLEDLKAAGSVFIFTSTQCPISNLYTPRINELAKTYSAKGYRFFIVDSNREDGLPKVKAYAKERHFLAPVIKDNGTELADALKATRTPETVVIDSKSVVRYRGRIDDNPNRAKVIRNDLKEALDSLIAGKSVARARTMSPGCVIFRDSAMVQPSGTVAKVTYARDVAPILMKNCTVCHRDGEAAPFPLETYQHAKTWAGAIKDYTERRQMPPWKAVQGVGDFHDARALTDAQIATLAAWADAGAPAGDLKQLPPLPAKTAGGWKLGTPDKVLYSKEAYTLTEEGQDVYRQFVLDMDTSKEQFIKGIEFQADNRTVVHHMILYIDLSGKSVELDKKDPGPGYSVENGDGSIGIPLNQTVWVAGWAPGNTPRYLPEGAAFRIPKGSHLVLQVHYHKNGAKLLDQSKTALYLADESKVDQLVYTNAIIYPFLSLKPGVADQKVAAATTLRSETKIIAVMPHMHMLGRQIGVTAELPDGSAQPLIQIDDWNFNWQETYRYKNPPVFPAGTKLRLKATFDNTEDNPNQPSHPPRQVSWGEATTDEMCIGFYQFLVPKPKATAAN